MKRSFSLALKGTLFLGTCIALIILQTPSLASAKTYGAEDVKNIFPKTTNQIIEQADKSMAEAKQLVKDILSIPDSKRTFANTAKKLDELSSLSNFSLTSSAIHIFEMVSP